jgi:hypothetical protein
MAPDVWGKLAFFLALVALLLALPSKAARANGGLLGIAMMVGTVHYVLPLSRLTDNVAAIASFVLMIVVLWRLVGTLRAPGK